MAKRIFQCSSFTPTATTDSSLLVTTTYMAVEPGTATQMVNILEVEIGGQATASTVNVMSLARTNTAASATIASLATTPAATDGPMNSATADLAAPVRAFMQAGTNVVRSATGARLNFSFNAFGGIIRWVAAPGEEWTSIGNAAGAGSVISASTAGAGGSGLVGVHVVYEPF